MTLLLAMPALVIAVGASGCSSTAGVLPSAPASSASAPASRDAGQSNGELTLRIPVIVYNASGGPVTLNIQAHNDDPHRECRTNHWEYNGEQKDVGRLAPLAPGASLETLFITSSTCDDRLNPPEDRDTFYVGIEGASQFVFNLDVTWAKYPARATSMGLTWGTRDMVYYTGGGGTHGLVQYNAGNNGVLGSGIPGVTGNFRYDQGQQIYFSVCPQAAGNKKVKTIPSSCHR